MNSPDPFFERIGGRLLTTLVGPLDKTPELYARGRLRFALTRGGAYALVMLIALLVATAIARRPIFNTPTLVRIGAYTLTQFLLGAVLALIIWRMVERIAQMKIKSRANHQNA
ncbi:MAG: hypothetical protein ABJB66_07405 [Gemmatimonadaceae bacterium]